MNQPLLLGGLQAGGGRGKRERERERERERREKKGKDHLVPEKRPTAGTYPDSCCWCAVIREQPHPLPAHSDVNLTPSSKRDVVWDGGAGEGPHVPVGMAMAMAVTERGSVPRHCFGDDLYQLGDGLQHHGTAAQVIGDPWIRGTN